MSAFSRQFAFDNIGMLASVPTVDLDHDQQRLCDTQSNDVSTLADWHSRSRSAMPIGHM